MSGCIKEQKERVDEDNSLIKVEIDISDDVFLSLAKIAHEKDITFNQLCVDIIAEQISRER
jgi:hypothetical protein